MAGNPTWSPGDPQASSAPRTAAGKPGVYRNRLGAIQPFGSHLSPEISLRFTVGPAAAVLENAPSSGLDQLVKTSGKRLKRAGYRCMPPYPAEVAGFPGGRARTIVKKKKLRQPAGEPLLQMCAMSGPYSFVLTVPEAQAALGREIGPVRIDQPAPPAIVPVTWLPVPDLSMVGEQLILTARGLRLTAMITRDPVTASSDQFAMSCLQDMGSRLGNMAVNEAQPDTFLGGQYCVRHTFVLGGGTGSTVRSEYWWAGVVAGHGVQIFVLGTKTIIDLEHARRLRDFAVLIPPG